MSILKSTAAKAVLATIAGVFMLLLAQPANAASSGTIGNVSGASCGWHAVDNLGLPGMPYKVTTASLPSVTGTSSAYQRVWVHVSFQHWTGSAWSTYRDGWFYGSARAGVWTSSWTSYSNGYSGYRSIDDALGESGFGSGEAASPFTAALISVTWQSPSNANVTTGNWAGYETNPRATVYNPVVCNGGGNYA